MKVTKKSKLAETKGAEIVATKPSESAAVEVLDSAHEQAVSAKPVKKQAKQKPAKKSVIAPQAVAGAKADAGEDVFANYEDILAFNKDNLDAVVSANTVFVKGFQALNTEFFAIAQASFEKSIKATQGLFECTSVEEAIATQSEILKASYTTAVDDSQKLNQLTVKVAEESVTPLTVRANVAAEKITKAFAA